MCSIQVETIRRLILESSLKSRELDLPLPFALKGFIDDFATFLQILCNSSMAQGSSPAPHNHAVVFQSIKLQGLDPIYAF